MTSFSQTGSESWIGLDLGSILDFDCNSWAVLISQIFGKWTFRDHCTITTFHDLALRVAEIWTIVVYFDQQTGAPHAARCSK